MADGIDPAQIVARSTTLLQGKSIQGLTVKDAMALIADEMQKALDDSRPPILAAGAASINDAPAASGPGAGKKAATAPLPQQDPNAAKINVDLPSLSPSQRDMARLIASRFGDAGFSVIDQVTAIANAMRESNLNPNAQSAPPERSFGLFQLNLKGVGAGHTPTELKDPNNNISIMIDFIRKQPSFNNFLHATSLREAVSIFVGSFEQPTDQANEIQIRLRTAERLNAAQSLIA